jgi:hypothetical protein
VPAVMGNFSFPHSGGSRLIRVSRSVKGIFCRREKFDSETCRELFRNRLVDASCAGNEGPRCA